MQPRPEVHDRIALRSYVGVLAPLGVAYFLVPPAAKTALGTSIVLGAAAAIAVGVFRYRPQRRVPWLLLGGALVAGAAGNLIYALLPGRAGFIKSAMPVVSTISMINFALLIAGLVGLARCWQRRADWDSVIDAVIFALALMLLVWIFVIVPLRQGGVAGAAPVAPTAFPIANALLILATARFALGVGRTVSALLITVAMALVIIYDTVLVAGVLRGVLVWQTPADALWLLGYGLLGAAALDPTMARVGPRPGVRSREAGTLRLLLIAGAALIPPALMVWESRTGFVIREEWVLAVSVAVLVLVLARLASAVYRLRRQSNREHDLRTATAALVAAANPAAVEAAIQEATRRLLPSDSPCRLLLVPPSEIDAGEYGSLGATGVIDTALLPPSIRRRLGGSGRALAFPLVKADGAETADLGHIIVGAEESRLHSLRVPLATVASAATLALDRIRLSQEVVKHASEAYFRTLVQNAADIILVVDDDDRVRYATPSAAPIFGDRDLHGARLADLIEPAAPRHEELGPATAPHRGGNGRGSADGAIAPEWQTREGSGRTARLEMSVRDLRDDESIRARVITLHDVTEQRRLEEELTRLAFHDPLTGLPNRAYFTHRSQEAIEAGGPGIAGILLIDLDEFKLINDALGHDAGDAYLVAVANRLAAAVPPGGLVARLGGDEFAAIVVDAPNKPAIDHVAAQLSRLLAQPVRIDGELVACSASIGIAATDEARTLTEVMHHADLALYAAKDAGRGRYRQYEPAMRATSLRRLELRSALERALTDDALIVDYQPIVRLADGDVVGYEALLRWQHPTRGRLGPSEFIDAAEDSGLIVPIGDWVLRTAIEAATQWRSAAPSRQWYVSVNVSARQFQAGRFADRVRGQLDTAGLPPSHLVLEITESLLLRHDDRVWQDLRDLRAIGVGLAIDDFGTGYSALGYLRQMPLDIIKIDRLFTREIPTSPRQYALFRGIVDLAHTLGLTVVVEGVETDAERDRAIQAGCTFGQGFLFARPMPAAAVRRGLAVANQTA